MTFVRVGIDEIEIGQPLRWPLYDDKKQPLLARGAVVANAERRTTLFSQGVFRKTVEDDRPATGEGGERPAEDLRGLDEIRLDIGDTLQLQAQSETSQSRHYVKLIGFLKGKSVIVTTPTQDGKVLLMREGQAFVVRMFSGKSVYAFSATIFKVANVPFPHLHLTFPTQVRGLVVRRGARARVNLIAAITGADGRAHAGTVVDLSIGGAMLMAKAPIGLKDDRVKVKFRVVVSDVEQYLTLDAVLRAVHATVASEGEQAMVNHGLQFDSLPHAEQVVLSAYVYRVLFEESTEG